MEFDVVEEHPVAELLFGCVDLAVAILPLLRGVQPLGHVFLVNNHILSIWNIICWFICLLFSILESLLYERNPYKLVVELLGHLELSVFEDLHCGVGGH